MELALMPKASNDPIVDLNQQARFMSGQLTNNVITSRAKTS